MHLSSKVAAAAYAICLTFNAGLARAWDSAAPRSSYTHRQGAVENARLVHEAEPMWSEQAYSRVTRKYDYDSLNKTLYPLAFQPLPLGTIKPRGWFRQQLELMADGLPGHMHEFYRLVSNATWGGGTAEYSPLNEAWPYYINGLVPLAFALDDTRLRDEIGQQISFTLLRQFSDGWLGPEHEFRKRNFWGRYPFFLAAAQYVEAADPAESQDMLRAMHRFVNLMHQMLKNDFQGYVEKDGDDFDEQWGRSRAADMILALQWLYENHPADNHKFIHECMFMLYEKAFDWSWWFRDDIFLKEDIESYPRELIDPLFPFLHGVNAAQGLKSPAIMGRLVHDPYLFKSSRDGVELTFAHHAAASGAIIGDERISGNSPTRGTELCSVVETMFSLSILYQTLGDASFADRLENAAFNAMPAMIMPKWWAHQYVAQANQPHAFEVPESHFWNVGPWGLTFGLEPNYPCCTVNFPQGYPKLLSNSWVRTPKDNGVAHIVLLPSELKIVLQHEGIENYVLIRCETNYPFSQLLSYHVDAQESFKFSFRVPDWVDLKNPETGIYLTKATNKGTSRDDDWQKVLGSEDPQPLKPDSHSGLHTVTLPAGPISFSVHLSPFKKSADPVPVVHKRPNGAVALSHGALLFAYSMQGVYESRRPANYQRPGEAPEEAHDWTIVPRSTSINGTLMANEPWNIAIDPSTARVHEYGNLYSDPDCDRLSTCDNTNGQSNTSAGDWPNPIWSELAPPISISVMACKIEWNLTAPLQYEETDRGDEVSPSQQAATSAPNNSHRSDVSGGPSKRRTNEKRPIRGGYPLPPPLPNKKGRHKCLGRAFSVELRPYGSAKIRMSEFPTVDLTPGGKNLGWV